MIGTSGGALLGEIKLHTVSGRGFRPEELAEQAIDKIVHVGDQSHPVIQAQAHAFKERIQGVLLFYLQRAVEEHNTTIANRLRESGHPELVKLLEN